MMKKINKAVLLLLMLSTTGYAQQNTDTFNGDKLFATVKKFVGLGIHRTGYPADYATSAWLSNELKSYGYKVNYLEFPVKQFFLESATVQVGQNSLAAFPLWYVNDQANLHVSGVLADTRAADAKTLNGKIALTRLKGGGQLDAASIKGLKDIIAQGAKGIVAITENISGQIVASNTQKDRTPWAVPVVFVAPKDSAKLLSRINQAVSLTVKGTFKEVKGRNVYGTIGTGSKYVVISTPISGWFTCGGERGPGIATWLALAKWVSTAKLPYTFVFTGNSGHELAGIGANAFLDQLAPAPEKTALWVHLGAGIATLQWQQTATGLKKLQVVDPKRNIIYTATVKNAFDAAFKNIAANKREVNGEPVGELVYVAKKGYQNYAGAAYSHPYFHVQTDDANTTSPVILQEIALAFKNFIELDLAKSRGK
ncbi:hypothetical protein [Mucilaginibacter sp. SP1R1]|uniref:hypothetical protein n=1 Tax=Mucilaginibacter sp. SP1R1 TaxID=2723091 RepID=UPI0016177F78|nr:hypothetical protein [Mucilaginibacter sp. SP1R1]MBB6147657.1 hypothetical protein [Mucilaginibacter sp. SP1R1]